MTVYDLRLKQIDGMERMIVKYLEAATGAKKDDLLLRYRKLNAYREHLIAKRDKL